MGNLIIKRVKYNGEKYFFESPVFEEGLNIVVGDNGSGKSTLSYFIEFGLGGNVKVFNANNDTEKYKLIQDDKNNYVELDLVINGLNFIFKRFINTNDVLVKDNNNRIEKYPIYRNKDHTYTFSDWILGVFKIDVFELSQGSKTWQFNFNDLFRLLHYDQDTEPRKIFKSPSVDTFITDSVAIRNATFEILLGISSNEYYKALNEYKEAERKRDEQKVLLNHFNENYPRLNLNRSSVEKDIEELKEQIQKLTRERDSYQKQNTNVDDKTAQLQQMQTDLVKLELEISEEQILKRSIEVELPKIQRIKNTTESEIDQINKVIFTHEKLNLFSLEVCPFCMTTLEKKEGFCICGSEIIEEDYEKFLYNSNEYREIIKGKEKSLQTIDIALNSYQDQIITLQNSIEKKHKQIDSIAQALKQAIERIQFSGNSQLIDEFNRKIIETKEYLIGQEEILRVLKEKERIEQNFLLMKTILETKKLALDSAEKTFRTFSETIVNSFNEVYSILMNASSAKTSSAYINDSYMPVVDGGDYREKSANVAKRLMFYLTALSLALKYDKVNHPKFILIDTPESEGIDPDKLKENLKLIEKAVELGKDEKVQKKQFPFQIILTTGYGKYPTEFEKYVRLRFDKGKANFILKQRTSM